MHVLPHTVQGAEVILESYAQVYYNQFTTGNSPFQLVQWSTVPNNKKNEKMETSLKTGFAQIFLLLPQKSALLKLWGGCSPPRPPPPGPYAYENLYLPTISESSCRDWNFRIYPTVFWILPNVAENTRRCSDDFLKTSKRFLMIYCKHWLSGHSILDPRALMFLTLRVRS